MEGGWIEIEINRRFNKVMVLNYIKCKRYVMLKEKNLLLSDGIFNKKVIGVKGRMGKLVQLKKSMARLKFVIGEREIIREKY